MYIYIFMTPTKNGQFCDLRLHPSAKMKNRAIV